eukprot:37144-Eustigmatos_ZCMA.PRE.1
MYRVTAVEEGNPSVEVLHARLSPAALPGSSPHGVFPLLIPHLSIHITLPVLRRRYVCTSW